MSIQLLEYGNTDINQWFIKCYPNTWEFNSSNPSAMVDRSFTVHFNFIISFTALVWMTSFQQHPILPHNTFQQPQPLKCCIHNKYSSGLSLDSERFAGVKVCTQSPDVRLYCFLLHLSIGTCPLHPQISLAWSHYAIVQPMFRKARGSCCCFIVVQRINLQNFHSQILAFALTNTFTSL